MRGQAAIEYLATYGWAIMLLILVIGAVAYFGSTRVDNFLPNSCTIDGPFTCVDFVLREESIAMEVRNDLDEAYTVSAANFTYNDEERAGNCGRIRNYETDVLLERTETILLQPTQSVGFECGDFLLLDETERVDFVIPYRKGDNGFAREARGSIIAALS